MNPNKFIILMLAVMFSFAVSSCDKNDSLLEYQEVESNVEPNNVVEKATTRASFHAIPSGAIPSNWTIPQGYSGNGVALLKPSNVPNDQMANIYVIAVDLRYAKVGMVYDLKPNSETFYKKSLANWNSYGNFFAIANSLFFDGRAKYPSLPFPFRQGSGFVTNGNGGSQKDALREKFALNIKLDEGYAEIISIGGKGYKQGKKVIYVPCNTSGMTERSYSGFYGNVGNNDGVAGKTLIGIRDLNKDGKCEMLYLLVSSRKSGKNQEAVYNILKDEFKCSHSINFDGGGSSQLICKNSEKIVSSDLADKGYRRSIPVCIVIKEHGVE